jgi:GT2 family glycosyltransferase
MTQPTVTVVVVAYRSMACLPECITCLKASEYDGKIEIVVVNNSKGDETGDWLRQHHSDVIYVEPEENLGFGRANNAGWEKGSGELFLSVNPDAFVPPDAIANSVAYLNEHPKVGIVGAQFLNEHGQPVPSARMFPKLRDKLFMLSGLQHRFAHSKFFGRMDNTWVSAFPEGFKTDWVIGAYFMVRGDLMRKLEGFDPRFFLYFEEWDLCKRVAQQGYEVHMLRDVVVKHIGGASSDAEEESGERLNKQVNLMRLFAEAIYYRKHGGGLSVFAMMYAEIGWFRLRWFKYMTAKAGEALQRKEEFANHIAQVKLALRVTAWGKKVPEMPWRPDPRFYEEQ